MAFSYPTPEDRGGIANDDTVGAAVNADAIMTCLADFGECFIDPAKFYAVGHQIAYTASGQQIIGDGQLLVLTGAGKFDVADYGHGYAANSCAVFAQQLEDIKLHAKIMMQANGSTRTCNAVGMRGCIDADLNVKVKGFAESELPLIAIDSAVRGKFLALVRDSLMTNASLACQITGVGFDGNRLVDGQGNPIASTDWLGDFQFYNLAQSAGSLTAKGQQTTGLGLYTLGYSGANVRVISELVSQGLDLYGDSVNFNLVAKDCGAYGLKYVHGASHNIGRAAIYNGGIAPIVFGSQSSEKPQSYNILDATVKIDKQIWTNAQVPALSFDGISGTMQPVNNHIRLLALGDGSHMNYAVDVGSGQGNTIEDLGSSGWAVAQSRIQEFSSPLINPTARIHRANGTFIRAYDANVTSISSHTTPANTVPYDTEIVDTKGEFTTSTRRYVAQHWGFVNMLAQMEVANAVAGKSVEIRLERTRGGVVADLGRKIAVAVVNSTAIKPHQITLQMLGVETRPGDSFRIWADWEQAGSIVLNNVSTGTYWLIEEC